MLRTDTLEKSPQSYAENLTKLKYKNAKQKLFTTLQFLRPILNYLEKYKKYPWFKELLRDTNEEGNTLLEVAIFNDAVYAASCLKEFGATLRAPMRKKLDELKLSEAMRAALADIKITPPIDPLTKKDVNFEDELIKLCSFTNDEFQQTASENTDKLKFCLAYFPGYAKTEIKYVKNSGREVLIDPVEYAIRHCSPAVLQVFVDAGCALPEDAIFIARANLPMLENLIGREAQGLDATLNAEGLGVLITSSTKPEIKIAAIKFYLENLPIDWSYEQEGPTHLTLVDLAVTYLPEVLPLFLATGLSINLANHEKITALHRLFYPDATGQIPPLANRIETLKLLIQNNVNPFVEDSAGNTPIMLAFKEQDHLLAYRLLVYAQSRLENFLCAFAEKELAKIDALLQVKNKEVKNVLSSANRNNLTAAFNGLINWLEGMIKSITKIEKQLSHYSKEKCQLKPSEFDWALHHWMEETDLDFYKQKLARVNQAFNKFNTMHLMTANEVKNFVAELLELFDFKLPEVEAELSAMLKVPPTESLQPTYLETLENVKRNIKEEALKVEAEVADIDLIMGMELHHMLPMLPKKNINQDLGLIRDMALDTIFKAREAKGAPRPSSTVPIAPNSPRISRNHHSLFSQAQSPEQQRREPAKEQQPMEVARLKAFLSRFDKTAPTLDPSSESSSSTSSSSHKPPSDPSSSSSSSSSSRRP